MAKSILSLSQWETRVADCYSMARLSRMTNAALMEHVKKTITTELTRKHGTRAVYPAYVHGFVYGLETAHRADLYRSHLEFCYRVDGVLYSTHKESTHQKTEEFYARDAGHLLSRAPSGHYWRGTDKLFFGDTVAA